MWSRVYKCMIYDLKIHNLKQAYTGFLSKPVCTVIISNHCNVSKKKFTEAKCSVCVSMNLYPHQMSTTYRINFGNQNFKLKFLPFPLLH